MNDTAIINGQWELTLPSYRAEFHRTHPRWERKRTLAMSKVIKKGMNVVDVGSECGDYPALIQKWVGDEGNVILVEAVAKMWPSIKQIFDMNSLKPPLKTFVGFASDKTYAGNKEKVDYYNPKVVSGWPSVTSNKVTPEPGFQHLCENDAIPQLPLDDIVGNTHVDVLNMDVEGSECNVLHGATGILRRDRPIVFASLHKSALKRDYGYTIDDVDNLMTSLGYMGLRIVKDHELHKVWMYGESPGGYIL